MGWEGILSIALVLGVLGFLAFSRIAPDLILMAALIVLLVSGVVSPEDAFAGFGNTGLMTIAALYVVAAGLRETGAIQCITGRLLGQPKTVRAAQFRMLLPTAGLSAFLNNTTVVAMLIPAIQEWCQRLKLPPSKLLMPLSFTAILGGTCTLIGTSTNLVVNGLLQKNGYPGLGVFDISGVGLTLLLAAGAFLLVFGSRLLPDRGGVDEGLESLREYQVDMLVDGPVLEGRSISASGLSNLGYGHLQELTRGPVIIQNPERDLILQQGDRLSFVGAPRCAHELRSIQGLKPANEDIHKLDIVHFRRRLVEAVIGPDFPFLGMTLAECDFLGSYQAVVLSVSRGSDGNLPDRGLGTRLRVGDTLLLEAGKEFANQYRFRKDFLLVSALEDSSPPNFQKAQLALGILAAMVLLSAFEIVPILQAAWLAAGVMLVTGCMNAGLARRSIDFSVLTVIGASFALGEAMGSTGAAKFLAEELMFGGQLSPLMALVVVYALTVMFTEFITNNAAAVLMFPIAKAVAGQLDANFMPFAIAIMFAASASFITPIGYQTNLMVYGPGGYRLGDYLRLGVPLSILTGCVTIPAILWVWPL
ncbi:SLC13 family permease [Candidatus Thiothrix sp. Deng01]|uniref:SLC13 family permease n=1 Tax=Candidatus Thiothrix phosphatis TaxID=3112415 RepID=A0ABU6CSX1_9GAMM|nr:SLC13 family permease [Candidatus Thiothrix sp. Deng01]MEB4589895.1 SLC13 family permease [Candidatus Thiothrix sp. Deng01]